MTADTSLILDREGSSSPARPTLPSSSGLSARTAVMAVAVLITIAVAVALFIGQAPTPDGRGDQAAGFRSASPFSLPELRADRAEVVLESAPAKPTVVNFFAAWCEPCKRELPALRSAAASNPGVAFLGVDHQDSRDDAIDLLAGFSINYPAGYDPQGEVAARFGVRGLPATVFIDTDGRIVEFHQGEMSAKELQARLDRLTLKKAPA